MQHRNTEVAAAIEQLDRRVRRLDNLVARRDLVRMLAHARALYTELDQRLVESRQRRTYTADYDRVERELLEQLQTVERWLVWALLRF